VKTTLPDGNELMIRTENVRRLAVRIPGWARQSGGSILSTSPYREENGYAVFENLKPTVTIRCASLRPTLIFSDPRVTENTGKAAVTFGPTVYCLEECDNPDVLSLLIDRSLFPESTAVWNESEERTEILVPGFRPEFSHEEKLYGGVEEITYEPVTLRFIPYRDFANRSDADMAVWIGIM
ncbi:MAG: hypothetical protein IK088_07025, partial [Lachnospiraceae bacterium]|nr:hypothetical protein [Lachnospiraceae bacterium]